MPSALKSDLILGIESSCDETAAAVLRGPRQILSNVIASQVPIHRRWGGVVPELASRQHILSIDTVVGDALQKSGAGLQDLGGVAVTYGPGLVGSLLVGISVAKAIAMVRDLPLAAVNHIEGHIQSIFMEPDDVPLPMMTLVVSGGHTSLYLVEEQGRYRALAHTRDDAAGEAYDKVAKLLGLGYPGGPVIDRAGKNGRSEGRHLLEAEDDRPDPGFFLLGPQDGRAALGAGASGSVCGRASRWPRARL